ncbi:MAG TPA: 4-(cytidine 5'-diphospho)-2-C-methyl-D-erythritol kinase [Thermodesulfobacteriota bacterium]
MALKILSPAKVNLFLRVLGKRPDGYHDIFSLMQPVSLYDEIDMEAGDGEGISVSSDSPALPTGAENLAHRAASAFLTRLGKSRSVGIHIKKRIPVGAGLGGGSSNAASVLMGLNELTAAGFDESALMEIGSALGSDVPFFILKSAALAEGRGTELKRVKVPEFGYILINPGYHVSTARVYGNLDLTKKPENNKLTYSVESLGVGPGVGELLYNDLERVTLSEHPDLGEYKSILVKNGALGALMSGSGPTVFGVYKDGGSAQKAYAAVRARIDERVSVFAVKGL